MPPVMEKGLGSHNAKSRGSYNAKGRGSHNAKGIQHQKLKVCGQVRERGALGQVPKPWER